MPKLKNLFTAGRMNKDADSRLVPNGEYRDALNIKVSTSAGSDAGVVESVLSNKSVTSLVLGANPVTLGLFEDVTESMIYWWVTSDSLDYLIEYDVINGVADIILQHGSNLNFNANNLITSAAIIPDSDNGRKFIAWTDNLNPPRLCNITQAKAAGPGSFTEDEITLAKAPPLAPPTTTLGSTGSGEENNILDRFLRFSYRYIYRDGQVSALSPFTETAFLPETFQFDYSTASNESMENSFNQVTIGFNTGSSLVDKVELCFKESGTNEVWSIKTFDKSDESWGDNTTQSFIFTNETAYTARDDFQIKRLDDNVPIRAKALELIGSRLIFGNYTENYDIGVAIDFDVDQVNTAITAGTPTRSLKSNRNYEVGIVYLDDYGRMSTVLISDNNSEFISNAQCDEKNQLRVTINNLAPTWATRYRFFLKQPRTDYDVIVPAIFYQDGIFVWVRLEADDQNKIKAGDYIYVKSDTGRILNEAVQTRVLEVVQQDVNFLENTTPDPFAELQLAGTYMKLKAVDYSFSEDSITVFEKVTEGFRSDNTENNFGNNIDYIEAAVYYGSTGLNDLTESGTFTGTDDIRFEIEIFSVGPTDTFRWREYTVSTNTFGDWNDNGGLGINITGAAQALSNGVSITFGAVTGHSSDDAWVVSAKSRDRLDLTDGGGTTPGTLRRRAPMHYQSKNPAGNPDNEVIQGGAVITIVYDDSRSDNDKVDGKIGRFTDTFISSATYANLEEWFFKENIITQLTYPTTMDKVFFRRGTLSSNTQKLTVNTSAAMTMSIMSSANYTGDSGNNRVRTDSILEIRELDNNIILETIPQNQDSNPYYEIGETYTINGSRYHQASGDTGEQNQTGVLPAIVVLDAFNCFAWGNGFESYKFKDSFNGNSMKIDSRPLDVIENYQENVRIADFTWSQPYSQDVNYNGLNEFNLARANFMTKLDDRYGSIQFMYAEDTNLIVFSENKVHRVPFEKDILFDADANGTLRESSNILGTPQAYAGEYGISLNPESFSVYGNVKYFADLRRGCLLRLSLDGITEISQYGMDDFFEDYFRDNPNALLKASYDLHDKEYVINLGGGDTTSFKESVKGFPSRYSFVPDWMGSVNNRFFSVKNGQLWEHYDEANPVYGSFYGTTYDSTMKVLVNEAPSEIKIAKAAQIEGNKALGLTIKSYLNDETASVTDSDIPVGSFINREGKWDAHYRGNTLTGDLSGRNVNGCGEVASVAVSVITMSNPIKSVPLAIGDQLFNSSQVLIGTITAYDKTANTITVDTTPTIPAGTFLYATKNARIDGGKIRGYNFEVDLTDATNTRLELFALNTEVAKSFPS